MDFVHVVHVYYVFDFKVLKRENRPRLKNALQPSQNRFSETILIHYKSISFYWNTAFFNGDFFLIFKQISLHYH